MTLRRLENLPPRRLSESEMTWLKNRAHDHRPEVKFLACAVFAERFPCTARKLGFFDRLKTTLWRSHRVVLSALHILSQKRRHGLRQLALRLTRRPAVRRQE